MNEKWLLRGLVLAALLLALWLGWQPVRAPERVGDVPYVPTRPEVVDRMLQLARVGGDDLVFDLGSGDGRVVIRAAQAYGARGRGFELDSLLVTKSRSAAAVAGVADRVEFIEGDLFGAELGEATVVTLYLLPTVNLSLRPRLISELAPGTPVVSQTFDMAEWQPDGHELVPLDPPADIYLWIIPAGVGGVWDLRWDDQDDGSDSSPAPGVPVLRLLQRFQELEGELRLGPKSVPVTGVIEGSVVTLETSRDHPDLGGLRLVGVFSDGGLDGEVVSRGGNGAAALPGRSVFHAARRPATVEGVWDLGPAVEPFERQWSLRLSRAGDRWTATRWRIDSEPIEDGRRLPGGPPALAGPTGNERPMNDLYVLGSSISFIVGADELPARRVAYHGLVEGDRINGMVHNGGALVPWTAVRRGDGQ